MGYLSEPRGSYTGWFNWIASKFDSYAWHTLELRSRIYGVFLLHDYLRPWLLIIYYRLNDIRDGLKSVGWWYEYTRDAARQWLNDNYVWQYLNFLGNNIKDLRNNPISFIKSKFSGISYDMMYLVNWPFDFVKLKLYRLDDWFYTLVHNPRQALLNLFLRYSSQFYDFLYYPYSWVVDRLKYYRWDIRDFLNFPHEYIKNKIRMFIPDWDYFINNPYGWLINKLSKYSSEVSSFIRDPRSWLRGWIAYYLGLPDNFWTNPGYHLLNKVINDLNSYLDTFAEQIKNLLIRIILKFI